MRITRATDYGILGLIYLASKPEGSIISIREISENLEVSRDFMVRIFDKLPFVKSFRGPKGGVRLTRHPGDISFMEVIRALEGHDAFELDDTLIDKFSRENGNLAARWKNLQHQLVGEFDQVTIECCAREGSPMKPAS